MRSRIPLLLLLLPGCVRLHGPTLAVLQTGPANLAIAGLAADTQGITGKILAPSATIVSNNSGQLIGNNASSLVSNNAGSLVSNNSAGVVGNNAGAYKLAFDPGTLVPLAGASVIILDELGHTLSRAPVLTDASGSFHFAAADLAPGGKLRVVRASATLGGLPVVIEAIVLPNEALPTLDASTTLASRAIEAMLANGTLTPGAVTPGLTTALAKVLAPAMTDKAQAWALVASAAQALAIVQAMAGQSPALATALAAVAGIPPGLLASPAPTTAAGPAPGTTPTPRPAGSPTGSPSPPPAPTSGGDGGGGFGGGAQVPALTFGVSGYNPASGAGGSPVTIFFGTASQTPTVTFADGSAATLVSAGAGQITVDVPASAPTGGITLTVGAQTSTGPVFTVTPLAIARVAPTTAAAGATINLVGSGFGVPSTLDTVTFTPHGLTTPVTAATVSTVGVAGYQLAATVPVLAAGSYDLHLTVGNTTVTAATPVVVPAPGALLGAFSVGTSPQDVVVDAGDHIWVTNNTSGSVTELTTTGSVLGTYPTAQNGPYDLAFDSHSNVWVTGTDGSIAELSSAGTPMALFTSLGGAFHGIAIDSSDHVWVADTGFRNVDEYDATASLLGVVSPGLAPEGISIDGRGNVWAVSTSTISEIVGGSLSNVTQFAISPGGANIAFDVAGHAWVTAPTSNQVCEFPASLSAPTVLPGGQAPSYLAFDSLQHLWVADAGGQAVAELSATGVALATFTPGIGTPEGLAIDHENNVWVVDQTNNSVVKLQGFPP